MPSSEILFLPEPLFPRTYPWIIVISYLNYHLNFIFHYMAQIFQFSLIKHITILRNSLTKEFCGYIYPTNVCRYIFHYLTLTTRSWRTFISDYKRHMAQELSALLKLFDLSRYCDVCDVCDTYSFKIFLKFELLYTYVYNEKTKMKNEKQTKHGVGESSN